MNSRHLLTALATAALITGGQALAQGRGGGHGGGNGGGHGGGHGGMGGMGGSAGAGGMGRIDSGTMTGSIDVRGRADADTRASDQDRGGTNHDVFGRLRASGSARSNRRANSQGPAHASDTGIEHSNENSVLHDTTVTPPDLSGLATGMAVRNSAGTDIGTISRIVTSDDGTVRSVLVAGADGQRRVIQLRPGTLTVTGGIVTTTDARVND